MARHSNKTLDVRRLGEALKSPDMDTRVWTTSGRIAEQGDSVRWDSDLGWVVDVVAYGTGLDGDDAQARIATNHPNEFIPLPKDCEVMLAVPDGDTEATPAVIGTLNNEDGCDAPGTFVGLTVDGSLDSTSGVSFKSLSGDISPYDYELKHSPHNRVEEYDGYYLVKASNCVFEGDQIRFAARDASQSLVRGEDMVDVVTAAIEAMVNGGQLLSATAGNPVTLNALTWDVPITGGKATMKAKLAECLSSRMKGE